MPIYRLKSFNFPGFGHQLITPRPAPVVPSALEEIQDSPPKNPLYMKQVHGGTVHLISERDRNPFPSGSFGDGIITDISRTPLMVFTADCIPLIIAGAKPRFIGVIHASWRSVVVGIIENTLRLLKEEYSSAPANIQCVMGPCILGEDYEVGPEVAWRFPNSIREKSGGKYLLDLPAEVVLRLTHLGVPQKNIAPPPLSTFREKWLPSYRREGDTTERIETVVWLE
ncbi:MAG: polyphenol oxidase family protein [bacterium]